MGRDRAVEPLGLERVGGPVRAEVSSQVGKAHDVSGARGDEEEGTAGAVRIERYERAPGGARSVLDGGRQRPDGGGVEEHRRRQLPAESPAHFGEQPDRQERVAPEVEEIIPHPDRPHVQQALPDVSELQLDGVARSRMIAALRGRRRTPRRVRGRRRVAVRSHELELTAIDLPRGRRRQGFDHHEPRGHHVARQVRGEEAPQLPKRRSSLGRSDRVSHEPIPTSLVADADDRAGRHPRMPADRLLHLARLDPEASDLHQTVATGDELQVAVRAWARYVPGLEEPSPRLPAERIGDEPFRRQRRAREIAASQARPPDVKLSRFACGNRTKLVVEDVGVDARDRLADTHRLAGADAGGGGDSHLGGAIDVPKLELAQRGERPVDEGLGG